MGAIGAWRQRQARSLCDAYLGLSHDSKAPTATLDYLKSWSGFFDLEFGSREIGHLKIREALDNSQTWDASTPDALPNNVNGQRQIIKLHAWMSMYYSQVVSARDVFSMGLEQDSMIISLLWIACWERDPELIELLTTPLEHQESTSGDLGSPSFSSFRTAVIELLLELQKLLRGTPSRAKNKKSKTTPFSEDQSERTLLFTAIIKAEIAITTKINTRSVNLLLKNDELLQEENKLTPPLLMRAVHYRNVLEALPNPKNAFERKALLRAEHFFAHLVQKGYNRFTSSLSSINLLAAKS